MKNHIKAWVASAEVRLGAVMLITVPYTDQIIQGINDYLPSFAPYMPPNVYKAVGCAVVAYTMVQAMRRKSKAVAAAEVANG